MGLMQLMPRTWRELRAAHRLGPDPHHPRDNILAGAAYLRAMHDRFGYPGLFAAYNAGPARYAAHLARGHPLPAETVAYVAAVAGADGAPLVLAEAQISVIFVQLSSGRRSEDAAAPGTALDALFVRLGTRGRDR
jgi:soluble lytic murein transglycosylase-like protein